MMTTSNRNNETRKEAPLSDELIKSVMTSIDIKELHLTGQQILIYHDDQNKQEGEKLTQGGVIMSEQIVERLEKARLEKITTGTIVAIGPTISDKEIQVGKQALFFRHASEGGIKGMDGNIYVLFQEYNIRGVLPAPVPVSPITVVA